MTFGQWLAGQRRRDDVVGRRCGERRRSRPPRIALSAAIFTASVRRSDHLFSGSPSGSPCSPRSSNRTIVAGDEDDAALSPVLGRCGIGMIRPREVREIRLSCCSRG